MKADSSYADLPWRELGLVLAVKALALVLIWWLFFAERVEADLPARLIGGG